MTVEQQNTSITSLQWLRALAAIMVVLYHIHEGPLARVQYHGFYPLGLQGGVSIFFVISGFVMWRSSERNPGRTAPAFMRDRIARIVPLYWLVTLGTAALILFFAHVSKEKFDLVHLLASLFFIAHRDPVTGDIWPVVIPGWTLNFEMFFYLVFAFGILVSAGVGKVRDTVAVALICMAVILAALFPAAPGEVRFYGDPIMLEFLAGMGISWIYAKKLIRLRNSNWLLAAIAFVALLLAPELVHGPTQIFYVGASACLVVLAASHTPSIDVPILKWLGDTSYSLYLTHGAVLGVLGIAWVRGGLANLPVALLIFAGVLVSVAGAGVSYYLLERPLTRLAQSLTNPSGARTAG